MADNYVENHHNDYLKRKAKKEQERKHRLHKALVAYRNSLKKQREELSASVNGVSDTKADTE